LNKYFHSASYSNLGAWSFVSEGLSPPKTPPWRRDSVAKLQLAFQCNWLGKVLRLRDLKLARYVKLSVYKHDRTQSCTKHSGNA